MSTEQNIIDVLKMVLGSKYPVIESYDEAEKVDGTGCIAINVTDWESMNHSGCNDYKISVSVNGQTFIDEDKNRTIIKNISNHIMDSLTAKQSDILNDIEGCAGIILNSLDLNSDGDINICSINFDLFVCDCDFS